MTEQARSPSGFSLACGETKRGNLARGSQAVSWQCKDLKGLRISPKHALKFSKLNSSILLAASGVRLKWEQCTPFLCTGLAAAF